LIEAQLDPIHRFDGDHAAIAKAFRRVLTEPGDDLQTLFHFEIAALVDARPEIRSTTSLIGRPAPAAISVNKSE